MVARSVLPLPGAVPLPPSPSAPPLQDPDGPQAPAASSSVRPRAVRSSPGLPRCCVSLLAALLLPPGILQVLPYQVQGRPLQHVHKPLQPRPRREDEVVVHPQDILGGYLGYGQVPACEPALGEGYIRLVRL